MDIAQKIFEELTEGLPRFEDGRINFTDAAKAPVINVVMQFRNKILILKRSNKVSNYKGLWNGVSGFIDEQQSLEFFALNELQEELSIDPKHIANVRVCEPYVVEDHEIGRTWYVFPVLATLNIEPTIQLDWEHDDFKWIQPSELRQYACVKDFDKSVQKAIDSK